MAKTSLQKRYPNRLQNILLSGFLAVVIFLASGCGGTKLYNTNKTIVYRDSIYNITNVQQIVSVIEGKTSDAGMIDLKGVDRKQFESHLKQHGPIFVSMKFQLDDQELVYRAQNVESWKQFKKMNKSFRGAGQDIADLLAHRKDTQVELR
jgi:hypothetical protein